MTKAKTLSGKALEKKLIQMVNAGYTQAAFRYKHNAKKFADLWVLGKGAKRVKWWNSSGPVVEGGYSSNAYYVVVDKGKAKPRKK